VSFVFVVKNAYRNFLKAATDKELRADGNIYAGAIPGCFIIELMAQLAHQLAP
jgi:hypothetical protein